MSVRPTCSPGERSDQSKGAKTPFYASGVRDGFRKSFEGLGGLDGGGGALAYQLRLNLGGDEHLSKPYIQNPWVYACINAKARAAASIPPKFYKSEDPGGEEIKSGPLVELFRRPNPLMTRRKLLRTLSVYQSLCGETFLFCLKNSGGKMVPVGRTAYGIEMPDEMWPVRGDLVEMVEDEDTKLPKAWRIFSGESAIEYPAHSVIQINEIDPYDPLRG